jgi:hypothetical protein
MAGYPSMGMLMDLFGLTGRPMGGAAMGGPAPPTSGGGGWPGNPYPIAYQPPPTGGGGGTPGPAPYVPPTGGNPRLRDIRMTEGRMGPRPRMLPDGAGGGGGGGRYNPPDYPTTASYPGRGASATDTALLGGMMDQFSSPRPTLDRGAPPPDDVLSQNAANRGVGDWESWAVRYMPDFYQKYRDLIHGDGSMRSQTEAETIRKAIIAEMQTDMAAAAEEKANRNRVQTPGVGASSSGGAGGNGSSTRDRMKKLFQTHFFPQMGYGGVAAGPGTPRR